MFRCFTRGRDGGLESLPWSSILIHGVLYRFFGNVLSATVGNGGIFVEMTGETSGPRAHLLS